MGKPTYIQVIDAALAQGRSFDEILAERFPGGPGGVGHAHRKTRQQIKQQILDFYEPRDNYDDVIGRGMNEGAQCG